MPILREDTASAVPNEPSRSTQTAILRAAAGRCPACGKGALWASYIKVAPTCDQCGEELHHQRADDAPAYFTMFIVGHIVVGGLLALEQAYAPATWVHLVIWLPLTILLSLLLLPVVKGTLIAIQWAGRMHGFGTSPDPAAPSPDPAAGVARNS